MTKYIIHPGTLTIINADECLVLDLDTDLTPEEREQLDGDDYFDDALIASIAEERGKKFPGTDLTTSNSISFSPSCLRAEAEYLLEDYLGDDIEGDLNNQAVTWCADKATDEQLNFIAGYILNGFSEWSTFNEEYREAIIDGIRFGYEESKKGDK